MTKVELGLTVVEVYMKGLILGLLLIPTTVVAEHEVGVGYSDLSRVFKYKDGSVLKYDLKAIQLKYSYWTDFNLGIQFSLSKSDVGEEVYKGNYYTSSVPFLWRAQVTYKHDINDTVRCFAGAGITEFRTKTLVNGEAPVWSKGTDSHKPSYVVGCSYNFYEDYSVEVSYGLDNVSTNAQKAEVTSNTSITLIKRF